MNKKDRKLFDKATHNVKAIITGISEERKEYHKEDSDLRKEQTILRHKHDKKVKRFIAKGLKVLKELYILYDDFSEEGGR